MGVTGLVTPRCYAAGYRDCDGRSASLEHWISRALLERIQFDGTGLRVEGFSWIDGARDLRPSTIASKVLCGRHNTMLHTLDNAVLELHDAWLDVAQGKEIHRRISGDLLERWALKVLVGMVASGSGRIDGIKVKTEPPEAVVDVVFGRRSLPSPRGFYFVIHEERDDGLKIKVNTPPRGHELEGIALGITIQFLAFRFLTWLHVGAPHPERLIYRPAGFDFAELGKIDLEWIGGAAAPAIPLDLRMSSRQA